MTEAATRFCAEFWRDPQRGRLLALIGNNGTGKTRCAEHISAWAKKAAPSMQYVPRPGVVQTPEIRFHHWPSLLDALKSGNWDLVELCENAELLILDELGGAHDPTGLGTDKLCRILSRRERKWTLITSNLMPEEWEGAFDRRVLSRLIRNSEIVLLDEAQDYSKIKPA